MKGKHAMPKKMFLISRFVLKIASIKIEANNEDQALALAKTADDSLWEEHGCNADYEYQSEGEI
jgi:hypothetical protein